MKEDIVAAFHNSLNPLKVKEAEAVIKTSENKQRYCMALMEIVDDSAIAEQIRMAALIQLKINIQRRWKKTDIQATAAPKVPIAFLSSDQKSMIRQYILPAMIRCAKMRPLLPTYKKIVKVIVGYDWNSWNIKESISAHLTEEENIPTILQFLVAVCSSLEMCMNDVRLFFNRFIAEVFPFILSLLQKQPSLEIVYLCIKCYWKAMRMDLCQYFVKTEPEWMKVLKHIIDGPAFSNNIDFQHIPKNTPQFYYYYAKKWATRSLTRYFQRHANGKYDKYNTQFADKWLTTYAPSFVQSLYTQLTLPNLQKTKYFEIKSLANLINFRHAYVENILPKILYEILVPHLQLTPEDQRLVTQNPLEYFRKEGDIREFTNIKSAATDLWIASCDAGENSETGVGKFMVDNMKFIVSKLQGTNMLEKQMAMYLLCRIVMPLTKAKQIKSELPAVILQLVVPEFNNPIHFLRARAISIIQHYGRLKWPNQQSLAVVVEGVFRGLTEDTHSLVNIKAVTALNNILSHEEVIQMLRPHLSTIIKTLLAMMDKYDIEEIVNSLETVVSIYSQEMGPLAEDLVKHLSYFFLKYSKVDLEKNEEDQNYDGDVQYAAAGVIQTIKQLIESPLSTETLQKFEPYIVPILVYAFGEDGFEYVQDAIRMLNIYLVKMQKLSPQLWFFFPIILYNIYGLDGKKALNLPKIVEGQEIIFRAMRPHYSEDAIAYSFPIIRTYIYKCKESFFSLTDFFNVPLVQLTIETIKQVFKHSAEDDEETAQMNVLCATHLLLYMIENLRPLPPALIVFCLHYAKVNSERHTGKTITSVTSQMVGLCLFLFPYETMQIMDKQQSLDTILRDMINSLAVYNQAFEKQRIILGLSSILRAKARPAKVMHLLDDIWVALGKLIINTAKQRNDENPDDYGSVQRDLSEDGLPWDQEHGDEYLSILNQVDQIAFFQQCIKTFQANHKNQYDTLMAKVLPEDKARLQKYVQIGKSRFLENQSVSSSSGSSSNKST